MFDRQKYNSVSALAERVRKLFSASPDDQTLPEPKMKIRFEARDDRPEFFFHFVMAVIAALIVEAIKIFL